MKDKEREKIKAWAKEGLERNRNNMNIAKENKDIFSKQEFLGMTIVFSLLLDNMDRRKKNSFTKALKGES